MNDPSFNNPGDEYKMQAQFAAQQNTPPLVGLLLRMGIARDQKQAELILMVVGVICIILAGYIFMGIFEDKSIPRDQYPELYAE